MKKAGGITFLWLIILAKVVYADGVGTTADNIIGLDQGARAAGLGGAYTSMASDFTAIHWNPAGLAGLKSREMGAGHVEWIEDVRAEFMGVGIPIAATGTGLGFGLVLTKMGGIDEKRNGPGPAMGEVEVNSRWVGVSVGQRLGDKMALGATIKQIHEELDGEEDSSIAFDLGGVIRPIPALGLGLAVINLGGGLKPLEEESDLPLTFRGGVSYDLNNKATLVCDLEKVKASDLKIKGGVELKRAPFALRLGYQTRDEKQGGEAGFSGGLGLYDSGGKMFEGVVAHLDYAASSLGDTFGTVHWVTLRVVF
ncbi:MAG: PorV/PorQ family protein [bacterium]